MPSTVETVFPLLALAPVGESLDSAEPAFVVAGPDLALRFLNAAAAARFGVASLAALQGAPPPLAPAVLDRIRRFAARARPGARATELVRSYSGLRPVVTACRMAALDGADGAPAGIMVWLPGAPAREAAHDVAASLTLLAAPERLIAAFDAEGEVLAASGDYALLEGSQEAIEDFVVAAADADLARTRVTGPHGAADALVVRIGGSRGLRLIAIEPAAPEAAAPETAVSEPAAPVAAMPAARTAPPAPARPRHETGEPDHLLDPAFFALSPAPSPDDFGRWRAAEPATPPQAAAPEPAAEPLAAPEPAEAAIVGADAFGAPPPAGELIAELAAECPHAPPYPGASAEDLRLAVDLVTAASAEAAPEPAPSEAAAPAEPIAAAPAAEAAATDGRAAAEPIVPEPAAAAEPAAPEPAGFAFTPGRARRFVWQMDAAERFTFVSDDLALAVGPRAADVVGATWAEVSGRLGLDPDGRIAGALARRDTWSGLVALWPVDGAPLRVPVDLAALPAFGRRRSFEGFRGFGICRTEDAVPDAEAAAPHPGAPDEIAPAEPTPAEIAPAAAEAAREASAVDAPDESEPLVVADEPAAIEPAFAGEIAEAAGIEPEPEPEPELVVPAEPEPAPEPESAPQTATAEPAPEPAPPAEPAPARVVAAPANRGSRIVTLPTARRAPAEPNRLTGPERTAFRQIAAALGARIEGEEPADTAHGAGPRAPQDRADHDAPAGDETGPSGETGLALAPAPAATARVTTVAPEAGETQPAEPAPRPAAPDLPDDARAALRVLDRLPIGCAVIKDDGIAHANEAFLDLLGYADLAELEAAGGLDAIFAGEHVGRRFAEDGQTRPLPVIAKSGAVVPVAARLAGIPWGDGGAVLLTLDRVPRQSVEAVAETVSGRAALEALGEARERANELEAIVDTATDGVLMLDGDGRIVSANRAAEALFGMERAEMVGRGLADLLAPESRRSAQDYLDGLARNGVASVLNDGREVIGQVRPEGLIPLFMTIGRISAGPASKFCAVLRDITQWKKSEEELTGARRRAEEASSHKSEFLAKISHEIRTPLNAIIGFSEVMLDERFGPIGNERYKDYLRDIHTSGSHIMSLINDLLDLSKVEAGKMELKFEAVSLADIASECVAIMQPQANRERIIIRTSLPASVPAVVADGRSVRQIVLNLLSNAVKFTPAGGQVIVSTAMEDTGEVVLRVRDTGYGMSEKDIQAALEPFRQLHTTRVRGGGTGLGLPLTKALVEANRASFRIDSVVNQGTLVSITFPVTRVLAA